MSEEKNQFWSRQKWLRGLVMLLFWVILQVALSAMGIVVLVQFIILLVGREVPRVNAFAASLSVYIWQILQYLGFATEARPFPFSSWPRADEIDARAIPDADEQPSAGDEPSEGDDESSDANEQPGEDKAS